MPWPRRYVKFCMSRVRMLLHHGVIPIVVFDGDKLPAKEYTEVARQRRASPATLPAAAAIAQANPIRLHDFPAQPALLAPEPRTTERSLFFVFAIAVRGVQQPRGQSRAWPAACRGGQHARRAGPLRQGPRSHAPDGARSHRGAPSREPRVHNHTKRPGTKQTKQPAGAIVPRTAR